MTKKEISHGNKLMVTLLKKMFPGYTIKPEYHIGERLRLDAYMKILKVGWEYNGEQHYEPVCFGGISFEEAQQNLRKQQERDQRKRELCKEQGITLIIIKYTEELTKDLCYKKLKEALCSTKVNKTKRPAKRKGTLKVKLRKIPSRKFSGEVANEKCFWDNS